MILHSKIHTDPIKFYNIPGCFRFKTEMLHSTKFILILQNGIIFQAVSVSKL